MIFIKNISIKRRVLTGYAILITLMSVVFYISLDALSNATIGFKEYRTIARVTNISGRIQANMLKLRMNAKNFQIDGDQSFLLDYNETLKKLDALIAEGEITVLNNEEKAEIQNIKKKVKTYDTNFTKIVDFRLRRDDYVYHILDLEGPFMEKSLSNILATAEADGDQIASFHTAYVLKRLLLARLYVSKFLDTNDDNAIERVKMEFSNMERQLSILKKDLQNPKRKKLRTQVQTSMVKYTQTFAELVSVIKNRNDIQKNILDKIGPEVASSIERMKLSVKNNQDSLGPRLQESNQVAETFIILVGIISLFISLFFSYIIVKSLTKPLGIITQSALSLSKGNVNLEIQIDTKDEIGVLANSFKKIIQSQKQKTEVAKKIADGDYLVDVPISSEEDLLGKSMVNMRDALQQREQELNQYKREVSVRAEELAEAKTAAEAATEAKSSFLANMSHEIRTPMNAVIGFSHLIQKTELNEKQEDYVRKIESSSQSLLGIINDILDFSKIEAGKLTIESADFDLENVFQDLANIITYKAHEKKLEIVFGIDSKVPTYLNGDPLRLGQILTNLSNNAIKFTADGEIIICADLVSEDEGSVVVQFSVKDSGIGIKQDKISSLFESFTQA
ncbi:MAG: ATP-binding protein, partial [Reichenbachiella sp.]